VSSLPPRALQILFVNGTGFGGSLMSTQSLAASLVEVGHNAALVCQRTDEPRTLWLHKRLENLRARTAETPLEGAADRLVRLPGRTLHEIERAPFRVWSSPVPANALGPALREFSADVVVAASVYRPQWRQMRRDLRCRGIPSVLYLREQSALSHLTADGAAPDLLVANSAALAAAAADAGYSAEIVPSVVDLSCVATASSRERVLVINSDPSYGGALALDIAERCPEIPFVLQESWHAGSASPEIVTRAAQLGNVTVRRFTSYTAEIYQDARLLLVPYPSAFASARPRSVLESQSNGIPVLATDLPGLREISGEGAVFVEAHADADHWATVLRSLWSDSSRLEQLAGEAKKRVQAPDVDPSALTAKFAALLAQLTPT
jgi:hypothetical protein